MRSDGILKKYAAYLDMPAHAVPLTLGEGETPLVPLPRLARTIGNFTLYAKLEGLNPTGSFKDRGMVAAVSEASGRGARTVICASTGNTAAAAAAYAARAGLKSIVIIPEGKVARGKLAASAMYGAKIIQIEGSFDDALSVVQEIAKRHSAALVNSVNPYRLEGQKTSAFEIVDELGRSPDVLAIPVGNAGNITAYHMGFSQYNAQKKSGMPAFLGVQAAGAAPLIEGKIIEKPETVATAIRIGNPARGPQALEAVRTTNGTLLAVSDAEILDAQRRLAQEGIWVEPASAAPLAGIMKQAREGVNYEGKTVVMICTGNGLKDPDVVEMPEPARAKPTLQDIEAHL
jgi:threonine synthase